MHSVANDPNFRCASIPLTVELPLTALRISLESPPAVWVEFSLLFFDSDVYL